jgi:hypothetical protein
VTLAPPPPGQLGSDPAVNLADAILVNDLVLSLEPLLVNCQQEIARELWLGCFNLPGDLLWIASNVETAEMGFRPVMV